MLKIYCFITGDDYNIIKNETPESIKKIKLFAMLICIPVILWIVFGYLLVTELMMFSFFNAVLTSLFIGILIFLIERSIVMSSGNSIVSVFRILIGLFIAILGAMTVDEVIFKNDVDKQMELIHRKYVSDEIAKWESDNSERINTQKLIAGESAVKKDAALNIYLDEINGTAGTGIRGVDVIAKEKYKIYLKYNDDYERETEKLSKIRDEFDTLRRAEITKLENSKTDGLLLHRIKALWDLILKDSVMMVFCIIFTLLILLIDLLVVINKMCSKKTNYERKTEMIELIGASRMKKMKDKDEERFRPSDLHPEVLIQRNRLKNEIEKIF